VASGPGRFGPETYADWRASSLGDITEAVERRLIFRLAGEAAGGCVLDVGCGDGSLALSLWRNGASRVVGCDVDPRMVAPARAEAMRHRAAVDYVVSRAEQMPFAESSFDLVTVITVLAFVPRPIVALREIARVLTPGGRLVVGDLGRWSFWAVSRRIRGWLGKAPMWNAAKFRSAGELRVLVQEAGFHVERVCGAAFYPRLAPIARLTAPVDAVLGDLTTVGAAFIAVRAEKEVRRYASSEVCSKTTVFGLEAGGYNEVRGTAKPPFDARSRIIGDDSGKVVN
jgi:ubiquinone/menaquinone biosynthesis C-methylase UbiE